MRQIRAIARSPRHLTEESDLSLLSRLGIMSPYHMIRQMQQRILDTTQHISWMSDGGDFRVHPVIIQRETQLLDMVQALAGDSTQVQVDAHSCQCDQCNRTFDNEAALRAHKAKMHSADRMSAAPTTFDRQVHGTDGMPKCSGCGHAFERWADLQKHIEENHCQGRIPSEAGKTRSVLERVQEGEIDLAQVQTGGIAEELQSELLQHCGFCRQWFPNDRYVRQHWTRVHKSESQPHIAMTKRWRRSQFSPIKGACTWCRGQAAPRADHRDTCPVLFQLSMIWAITQAGNEADTADWSSLDLDLPAGNLLQKWDLKCQICAEAITAKGLRKHMEQKHAACWQLVRSQVDKLCSAWSSGLQVRICQFCNSKYDKRYRHAISCHAVTQTALARVRAHLLSQEQGEHGADSRAGGSADAGGIWGGDGHSREEGADNTSGRGGLTARQAQQTQWQGECRQGDCEQRMESQSLQQEDVSPELGQRRRPSRRTGQAPMPGRDTPGGHAQYPEAIHELGNLRQDGSACGHTGLGDGFAKVEGGDHQDQQPAQWDKSEDHPIMVSTQPGDGDAQSSHGGSNEEGQGVGLVQRTRAMGLSKMVTEQSCSRTRRGSSASTNIGSDEIDRGPQGPDNGRNCHRFPLQEALDPEHAGRHGSLPSGRQFPKARGQQVLRFTRAVDGTGVATDGGIADSQRRVQAVPSSEQAGRAHTVRTLVLRNNANYCYANAAVRTMLWVVATDPRLETSLTNIGRNLVRGLMGHRSRRILIAGHILFGAVFAGWRSPAQQHDCAEFLAHLVSTIGPSLCDGNWEARREQDSPRQGRRVVVVDEGQCRQAISLDIPAGDMHSAQYLLHLWHSQAHTHALRQKPNILVLSFSRYGGQPGAAYKNSCCITWRDTVHVPFFTSGGALDSHTEEYDVMAAIMHHGDSVLAGHYTVHLTEAAGDTICDDNAEPAFHARDSGHEPRASRNVYILICRQRIAGHPARGALSLH